MKEIVEKELKLINKSIEALDKSIEQLLSSKPDVAIEYYNSVLQGFESIKNLYEKKTHENITKFYINNIEPNHMKVIDRFEANEWNNLHKIIEYDIKAEYKELLNVKQEHLKYEKLSISTSDIRFNAFKDNGLLDSANTEDQKVIQDFWNKHYGDDVNLLLHYAYKSITGLVEPRLIPQHVLNNKVIKYLNTSRFGGFYSDKNIYDLLVSSEHYPDVVLKCVHGQYFDADNNTISRSNAFKIFFDTKEDLIVKNSLSDDGKGVEKIKWVKHFFYLNDEKITLDGIESKWGRNFIVQKVIKQHEIMAKPHSSSVNTFRMVTLRWDNDIHYLLSYGRFGSDYSAKDNGGEGGVCVGISSYGEFKHFGITNEGQIVYEHPTTGFKFADLGTFPNFDKLINFVKGLHNRILHHNYVSWDIAVSEDNKPVFIEMNFRGPIWKYQLANEKPIFGDFTERILAETTKYIEEQKAKQKNNTEGDTNESKQ